MAFTVHQLSLLALAVYDNPSSGIDGWRVVRQFGSFTQGFYAALFAKGRTLALALRGTDDGWDIIPDLLIFMGQLPDQYAHATAAFDRSASYIGAGGMFKKFALTGHSLGGGLATLLAVQTGHPAVTFNAPGVSRSLASSLPSLTTTITSTLPGDAAKARVVNIRANFDIVSIGTGPQVGSVDSIAVAGCAPVTAASRKAAFADAVKLSGRPVGAAAQSAVDVMASTGRFVLCQHGMALMEQQLRNMPDYNRDLGW